MDVLCPVCGEPWELESLERRAARQGSTIGRVSQAFSRRGCSALGVRHGHALDADSLALIRAAYDVNGDDLDGAAATLDDSGRKGFLR